MVNEKKSLIRIDETPRDKPMTERTEHGNLDRPGAQSHPRAARSWSGCLQPTAAWRMS